MDIRQFARKLVSQNKFRFQDQKYDLDLSYITENIIAMGLPATGFEGNYRNPIEDVVKFLDEHHKGKYKVFNLCSEKLYDPQNFDGFMANFPFDDHNCPELRMIPMFCESAKSWLRGGIENVVCVHCKAGKSRTGLMICALLLYLGYFTNPQDAIDFYNRKRCKDLRGLVNPCQIRYVYYYDHVLRIDLPPPAPRRLLKVSMEYTPQSWRGQLSLVLERPDHSLFGSRQFVRGRDNELVMWMDGSEVPPREGEAEMAPLKPRSTSGNKGGFGLELEGDVRIEVRETTLAGSRMLFYTWFHTAFVEKATLYTVADVDKPKDKKIIDADRFLMRFEFEDSPIVPDIEARYAATKQSKSNEEAQQDIVQDSDTKNGVDPASSGTTEPSHSEDLSGSEEQHPASSEAAGTENTEPSHPEEASGSGEQHSETEEAALPSNS